MRRREELEAKMEAEHQRTKAERQRMEAEMVAERQRMELQMFEYMRGVYAAIGQPPPPFPAPPPPAPNTVSGTVSRFTTL